MSDQIANDLIRYAELVEDCALISPEEMNCASLMRLAAEALAQPEQERCVGCEACIDTACGRDECPKGWPKAAQPEQKPFAWYAIEHGEADIEWNSQRPIYEGNWKPLYRTPPQRTDQEQQIETLKRCLFQMQEAAKDLVKQAKSLPSTQRTWVGLTDLENAEFVKTMERGNFLVAIYDIEKRLKEKNT